MIFLAQKATSYTASGNTKGESIPGCIFTFFARLMLSNLKGLVAA